MTKSTFGKVWYLPEENRWRDKNMLAMRDAGALIVEEGSLEFQGRKETIHITDIKQVSYGKQGRDAVNNWVKIEYGEGKQAYFADGSLLGWGGLFGGTKRILEAVRRATSTS